ncbi:helix-turn-helix domain-containing protein [Streptomyces venezuelae]|uniref:helix-turn-helix domain-containing protein n=1 Tax=Streptomyces venezuelae TaxID=54571 RepID=UPI00278C8014|nr:helix-turn-helix transcriptional regulator [Streptomyces venezuelae]
MTELARTQGSSSEIERGGVPEVAALGKVLTDLFKRLGIPQSQYAHRVHLDKSAVSRYLSGRRLAPQDFVDRLVREVEEHLGAPLRQEAKDALRDQRLDALRVCNPDEFQLETLRGELARSRRDTRRADRNIEALHTLLERKEAEVRHLADDLTRLRLDWGAERADLARTRDDLRREVARLREDLDDAELLRADAERRGGELREQVLELEEELSRRGPSSGNLPLAAFKDQLVALWEEEDFPEASRELTEAAWSRPLAEAVELLDWVKETAGLTPAVAFVADVARLRPLPDVLAFAPEVAWQGRSRVQESWTAAVAARVTTRNAAVVHRGLRNAETLSDSEGDRVLAEAVARTRSDATAVGLVTAALSGSSAPPRLFRVAETLARRRRGDHFGLRVAVGLAQAGRHDMAALVLTAALPDSPDADGVRLGVAVLELTDAQIDTLFDLVTWLDDTKLMTTFAVWLNHPRDTVLLDRLLGTMARQGRLGLLDLGASRALRDAVGDWRRRSRGQ